jgi:protein required for attachment to host cells
MQLLNGASVLVTDGRKALLFQNNGDAEFPDLRLVQECEQQLEPDHALNDFARQVAEFLEVQFAAEAVHELILVAPPRTLGEIRKHLRPQTCKMIRVEIDKDLVKHPIAHIESLLAAYPEPA